MDANARSAAFERVAAEVYEPVQRYLRRRCAASDVDDVLNDALLVMWRRIEDAPTPVLPWSYAIARRCLANQYRGRDRRVRLARRLAVVDAVRPAWEPEDGELHEALASLGDLDREVIRLWAWERLEPREIAEVLDMSPNAVSVRLNRIRKKLEDRMARKDRAPAGHKRDDGQEEER